jgi:hypothetical protein
MLAVRDVAHLQRHQITRAQLAVDAQVEQRQLASAALLLQPIAPKARDDEYGPRVLRP